MSNKARFFRKINVSQNIATVVISSLLLFFGFSGLDKILKYVKWIAPNATLDMVELAFNLTVFLLFVVGILHLVFRFSEKQGSAERAVAALASLHNEIEDVISSKGNLVISDVSKKVEYVRSKYETISEGIPANSDREFRRAKDDLRSDEPRTAYFQVSPQDLFNVEKQEAIVSSIVLGSRANLDALEALRKLGPGYYLGGGLMRNAVWDFLHGYNSATPTDDVDVVYFNDLDKEKRHDEELEAKLSREIPNFRWSVKNQARMHTFNNEEAYADLNEAIEKWPETATAFVVRLKTDGKLEYISPHGFDDLLRLIVRNTPAFETRKGRVATRISGKKWAETWPKLKVMI